MWWQCSCGVHGFGEPRHHPLDTPQCTRVDISSDVPREELLEIARELAAMDDLEASDAQWPYLTKLIRRAQKTVCR